MGGRRSHIPHSWLTNIFCLNSKWINQFLRWQQICHPLNNMLLKWCTTYACQSFTRQLEWKSTILKTSVDNTLMKPLKSDKQASFSILQGSPPGYALQSRGMKKNQKSRPNHHGQMLKPCPLVLKKAACSQ